MSCTLKGGNLLPAAQHAVCSCTGRHLGVQACTHHRTLLMTLVVFRARVSHPLFVRQGEYDQEASPLPEIEVTDGSHNVVVDAMHRTKCPLLAPVVWCIPPPPPLTSSSTGLCVWHCNIALPTARVYVSILHRACWYPPQ
jgi:hypothetical protein